MSRSFNFYFFNQIYLVVVFFFQLEVKLIFLKFTELFLFIIWRYQFFLLQILFFWAFYHYSQNPSRSFLSNVFVIVLLLLLGFFFRKGERKLIAEHVSQFAFDFEKSPSVTCVDKKILNCGSGDAWAILSACLREEIKKHSWLWVIRQLW